MALASIDKGRLKDKRKHEKTCSQLIFKGVGAGGQEMDLIAEKNDLRSSKPS